MQGTVIAAAVACLLLIGLLSRQDPRVLVRWDVDGDLPLFEMDLAAEDTPSEEVIHAFSACLNLCKERRNYSSIEWRLGPCLGEDIGNGFACDVAHCPRIESDENKTNQCHQSKWIEVDTDCRWLRYRTGSDQPREPVFCEASGKAFRLDYGVLPPTQP